MNKATKALISGSTYLGDKTTVVSLKDVDCSTAYHGLEKMDAEVDLSTNWQHFNKEDLEKYDVCVGGVNDCRWALHRLGVTDYDIPCYPKSLDIILGRKIEESTFSDVVNRIPEYSGDNHFFIKPKKPKRFEAFLTSDDNPWERLFQVDPVEDVYVSEIVSFKSEWRVYVREGTIIRVCNYEGNPYLFPNVSTLNFVTEHFRGPCCYVFDVGIVGDETCLVEINDFYSIGNYGLFPEEYAEMLMLRWDQLVNGRYPPAP